MERKSTICQVSRGRVVERLGPIDTEAIAKFGTAVLETVKLNKIFFGIEKLVARGIEEKL